MSDDENVYLYDSMYHKFAAYEKDTDRFLLYEKGDYEHFDNLTPECKSAESLCVDTGASELVGGIRPVKSYDDSYYGFYSTEEESLRVQLLNSTRFNLRFDNAATVDFYNGSVRSGFDHVASYFPVTNIKKR